MTSPGLPGPNLPKRRQHPHVPQGQITVPPHGAVPHGMAARGAWRSDRQAHRLPRGESCSSRLPDCPCPPPEEAPLLEQAQPNPGTGGASLKQWGAGGRVRRQGAPLRPRRPVCQEHSGFRGPHCPPAPPSPMVPDPRLAPATSPHTSLADPEPAALQDGGGAAVRRRGRRPCAEKPRNPPMDTAALTCGTTDPGALVKDQKLRSGSRRQTPGPCRPRSQPGAHRLPAPGTLERDHFQVELWDVTGVTRAPRPTRGPAPGFHLESSVQSMHVVSS